MNIRHRRITSTLKWIFVVTCMYTNTHILYASFIHTRTLRQGHIIVCLYQSIIHHTLSDTHHYNKLWNVETFLQGFRSFVVCLFVFVTLEMKLKDDKIGSFSTILMLFWSSIQSPLVVFAINHFVKVPEPIWTFDLKSLLCQILFLWILVSKISSMRQEWDSFYFFPLLVQILNCFWIQL